MVMNQYSLATSLILSHCSTHSVPCFCYIFRPMTENVTFAEINRLKDSHKISKV